MSRIRSVISACLAKRAFLGTAAGRKWFTWYSVAVFMLSVFVCAEWTRWSDHTVPFYVPAVLTGLSLAALLVAPERRSLLIAVLGVWAGEAFLNALLTRGALSRGSVWIGLAIVAGMVLIFASYAIWPPKPEDRLPPEEIDRELREAWDWWGSPRPFSDLSFKLTKAGWAGLVGLAAVVSICLAVGRPEAALIGGTACLLVTWALDRLAGRRSGKRPRP